MLGRYCITIDDRRHPCANGRSRSMPGKFWLFVHGVITFGLISVSARCDGDTCLSCVDDYDDSSRCMWQSLLSKCTKVKGIKHSLPESDNTVYYPDRCPVEWPATPSFLPDWMSNMLPVIGQLTLLDLSLPGTHDTLTYDLSLQTSDGGVDGHDVFAELMHNYTSVVPDGIEDFIRQQAQTQGMDITYQLNNGIRFIDYRMMLEYGDEDPQWYSLHFLQSNKMSNDYFQEIRNWLDEHREEVVVLWISKHGSACQTGEDQYPNTSIEEKQAYWIQIEEIFEGLLPDFSSGFRINETSMEDMIKLNARVIIYATDYIEFTNSSIHALDGCDVDNNLGPSVDNEQEAIEWEREQFSNANERKAQDKIQQKFYLMSMATSVPAEQVIYAAKLKWGKHNVEDDVQKCAAAFNITGMVSKTWLP